MMILKQTIDKVLHQIFEFGIFVKGINGVWESVTGLLLIFLNKPLFKFVGNFSHNTKIFVASYLLIHGILNLFLAVQLYRDRIWAYLATITVTTIFIFYQIHRIIQHHSIFLTFITVFDFLFVILAWHEYNRRKLGKVL
jgi:uncharacterized membrane protein